MPTGTQLPFGSPWPKRLYGLDISRGIAALSVVIWHWQHFAYTGTSEPVNFDRSVQPLYPILRMFFERGDIGVDYFFLLSGFIFFWLYKERIAARIITFKDFWLLRFSRLYPLHVATLLVVSLLQILYLSRNGTYFVYPYNDVYHFVLNAGFASAWGAQKGWSFNSPSWSVSVEILLYLVFFIAAYLRKGSAMSCLLISSAAFILRYYVPSSLLFNGLSMFFFGGFVFYVTLLLSRRSEGWINYVLGAAAVLWAGVWINYYMLDFGSDIMNLGYLGVVIVKYIFPNYVLFPATICALALIEIRKKTFWKPLSWIGDISFSAYLLHFPLQLAFGLAVGYGILGASFYLHPFYLMLYFSLLVLLSCLSYRKFERPIQNLLRSKFESRKGTQPPKAIE